MQKCRELSKLPKAKSIKSINFRRTTPGSIGKLFGWTVNPHLSQEIVDPTHPAAKLPKSTYYHIFPKFFRAEVHIHAFPKALLTLPDVPWPDPPFKSAKVTKWSEQLEVLRNTFGKETDSNADARPVKIGAVDMSMLCILGKKSTHKHSSVRKVIVRRLKHAVSLIVTRGADVCTTGKDGDEKKGLRLVLNDNGDLNPHEWFLPEWTYAFTPKLPMYLMPYPEMVSLLRDALRSIQKQAKAMEANWVSRASIQEGHKKAITEIPRPLKGTEKAPVLRSIRISKPSFGLRTNLETPVLEARSVPTSPISETATKASLSRILENLPRSVSSEDAQPSLQTTTSSITPSPSPIPRLFFPASQQLEPARSDSDRSEFVPRNEHMGARAKERLFSRRKIIKLKPSSSSNDR